jgi:trimeric autotransporter adhesin
MRAARWSKFSSYISALACAVALLSCGGDSTGPGGGNGSVTVSPPTDSVALGASVTLSAAVNGHAVSGSSVFWNTENAAIATVSSAGVVSGIAVGTVRIAASSGGNSGFSTITVVPPSVASVRVTPSSEAIKVGETAHLVAQPLDAAGNPLDGRTVTWSSASEAVATVDSTGLVTGVATGATTVTATSEGKTGTSGIAVAAAVAASITVAPTSVPITTGQTSQLTATVKDANGAVISGAPVIWSVDNANIALVSSTGLVTGQAPGTATVTATSGAVHFNVPVTVTLPPANAVIVSPSAVALLVTQRQQLTATVTDAGGNTLPGQTVTWSTSDPTIATVGTTGLVFAIAPGTATITGTSGSATGVSHVTVSLVPVRRVVVNPDAIPFLQGDPGTQLTVTLLDSIGGTLSPAGRPVTFSSNQTSVALVNATGFVTPTGVGQAVITATATGSGLSATSTVTVSPVPVASVTITPSLDTLIVGQQAQLTATTKDGNGNTLTGRTIVWDDGNDPAATVSSLGRVTAQAPGTMTVTATSEGKTGTATIVVLAVPVASVVISPTSASVLVGSTTSAFTAIAKDAGGNTLNGRTFTFASSNTAVATIDPNSGVATGVAPGSTNITATSEGKTSNNATLTVSAVPVASVTISPLTQTVVAGSQTAAFTAVTKDGSGNVLTGRTVTFSSTAPGVATVNAGTGVATGVAAGTTSIIASSEGQNSPAATLTVTAIPVASVTISPTAQSVVDGSNTPAFTVVTKDVGGNVLTGRVITFNSSNTGVATIAASGVATGQSPGTTTITAASEGKTSNNATLTVTAVPVASVTITPTTQSVVDGSNTPAFSAVTKDAGGNVLTGRVVTWSSSNTGVATINGSGVATGASPGTTTITATSETQTSNGATLTVTAVPVNNVVLLPASQSVQVGSTATFTATPRDASNNPLSGRVIVYSSSDNTIATIDASTGVATGVAPGTVTIGAISEGKNATASLTVTAVPVASVTVSPSSQTIIAGNSTTSPYTSIEKDAGGNTLTGRVVTWETSDHSVATIDNSGNATSSAPGTVTITATSEGHSGTASLTVNPVPVASVDISPSPLSGTSAGGTIQFTATPRDAGSNALTGRVITWTSSDTNTATVDSNGLMTAIADGFVTITAHCEGVDSSGTVVTILL